MNVVVSVAWSTRIPSSPRRGAAHAISLDLFGPKVVEGFDEVKECAHFEDATDLGKLREETREKGA